MRGHSIKISTRFLLLSLTIIYAIMPVVSRFISSYLTTYFYMIVVIWTLFCIIFSQRTVSLNHYVSILLPFILLQALTYLTRSDSILLWGYQFLLFLLPVAVGYYILKQRSSETVGYAKVICIAFGITIVTTIIGLIQFPFASRVLATIQSSQDSSAVIYNWHNIGGYEFIYMTVLLYPIAILAYKRRRIKAITMAIIAVSIFAMIVLSEYTTALLMFLLSTVLLFLKRDLKGKGILIFAIIGIVAVFLMNDSVSDFLSWLAGKLNSETMAERLNSLAGGANGLESSESNRIELYGRSISTFFSHPFLGTMLSGGGGIGGHSQIFDTFAQFGIIGVGLLAWMYRYIYMIFFKPFSREKGYGFMLWGFIETILLSTVNTGFWLNVLTLFMPILVRAIYNEKEE